LCLIAPTWRGPLPTLLGGRRWLGRWLVRAGDLPLFGQFLYRLNVNRPMVRLMARGHVYAERGTGWPASGCARSSQSSPPPAHRTPRCVSSLACWTRCRTAPRSSKMQRVSAILS
jgi:hypothetical protein